MGYRTVVTILQNPKDAGRVLDCAVPLSTRFGAHLIGIHAEAVPIIYTTPMEFPVAELMEVNAETNRERAVEIHKLFQSRTAAAGVSHEWHSLENIAGEAARSGASAARCADLVVAQQADPGRETTGSGNLNALIFESGRPVLFVPHGSPCPTTISRVLIAWNGKREAARATFDALPFIRDADMVEIFTVDPPEGESAGDASAGQVAAALARHGAKVSVASAASGGVSKSEVIGNRIAETGADLLVMGAYSHSRLRELLFGGVTRSILRSMPALTLMSR